MHVPSAVSTRAEPAARLVGAGHDESVCGVLVTHLPNPTALCNVVDAVIHQVDDLVVVDNASPDLPELPPSAGAVLLAMPANLGLAAAQNAGIKWARERGHSHVLLLDQDSVPAPDMVTVLLAAYRHLARDGAVGAVGPRFRDPREGADAPFVRVAFPMSHKLSCPTSASTVECDFLISSGSLIPLAVLDAVGDMDGDLFIDNVDLEWSFRARSSGFSLYGVCDATMEHLLGDRRLGVLGGLRNQVVHSPTRLYYMMRNRLLLYRRRHTPRVWIAQDLPRVLSKFLIFAMLVEPRRRNIRYMLRGVVDGVLGRSGPCPLEGAP